MHQATYALNWKRFFASDRAVPTHHRNTPEAVVEKIKKKEFENQRSVFEFSNISCLNSLLG